MGYIRFPIETDPETLVQEFFAFVKGQYPNWTPSDANLDVIIARFYAFKAGEIRDLVSDVQDDIFRFFGATMVGVQPFDAAEAQGTTTWTLRDTLGHTIPAGTAVTLKTADGTSIPFLTVADVTVAPGSSTTAVGEVLIQSLVPGTIASNLTGPVTLIDVKDWIASVVLVGTTAGGADAEADATYLDRLTRHMQRLSTRPVLPQDFASAAFDASPEVVRSFAIDLYNPHYNALTANEASAETDATGWLAEANTTVASSTTVAADGTKSVRLTGTAGGAMSAITPAVVPPAAGSHAVSPGDQITGFASVRAAAAVSSNIFIMLLYYNAAGGLIATHTSPMQADVSTAWTQIAFVSDLAPALSAFIRMRVQFTVFAGEQHYIDKASIHRGSSLVWSAGGTPETGNEKMITVSAIDAEGDVVSPAAKTTILNYLESQRETNFVVNFADPIRTAVDVTTTFTTLPGYDPLDVKAAIEAALFNYLLPKNWALDPLNPDVWLDKRVLYINELITLVNNVQGVDRVVTMTDRIAGSGAGFTSTDLTIPGPPALIDANVMTATPV